MENNEEELWGEFNLQLVFDIVRFIGRDVYVLKDKEHACKIIKNNDYDTTAQMIGVHGGLEKIHDYRFEVDFTEFGKRKLKQERYHLNKDVKDDKFIICFCGKENKILAFKEKPDFNLLLKEIGFSDKVIPLLYDDDLLNDIKRAREIIGK